MFGTASSAGSGFSSQNKPASFSFGSSNPNSNTNNNNPSPFGGSAGSGFSLGGTNANSAGGFGAKPAASGFGATNPSNTSGGLFGNNNNAAANPTANPPASGGIFGNNTANTGASGAPSGGLFGANNASTAGSTGTSLFGGNNAGANNTSAFGKPALTLGSTFGGSGANNTAPSSTGGGLFGSTQGTQPGQATSGGLFGNSQNSQPGQASTGGLFGNSQNSQPGQATSGGLFGKPAGTSTGGLFGGNTAQSQSQSQHSAPSGGGLFGNNNTSGGLFGSQQNTANTNTSTQINGASNNAQPSFSWSGNQQGLPAPTTSLSNLEIKIPKTSKTQQSASSYTPAVNDQLTKLKEQWDPNSAKCALKTHLYNKFSEQEIAVLLQQPRPANESPEDWEKAMAQRPSPLHFPVKVTSFTEMAQRVEVQLEHVAKSRVFLNNVYEKSTQLSSQRDLDTTTRIMKAKTKHTQLSRRLLRLATLLAVLKLKGYPLLPEEEEISKQFQGLNAKLSDPNGPVGKLSDLYARLAILKGRSEDLSSQLESSLQTMNGGLNNLSNSNPDVTGESSHTEQMIQSLTKLLYKQQIGLGYLNDVVQKDLVTVGDKTKK